MRLRSIIQENEASEKARQLGLVSDKFGRWKDKSGKVVAITKNGKLVMVKPGEEPSNNTPKAKMKPHVPTTMSKVDAGHKPKINAPDTQAGRDQAKKKNDKITGAEEEPQTVVEPNIFSHVGTDDPMRSVRTISASDIDKELEHWMDHDHLKQTIIPGEKVEIFDNISDFKKIFFNKPTSFMGDAPDPKRRKLEQRVSNEAINDCGRQDKEWRTKLPTEAQINLMKFQVWWQRSEGQWFMDPKERIKYNSMIDSVCEERPPICRLPGPIKRGMRIRTHEIKQYLSQFGIGKDVEMPPSGFSASGPGQLSAEDFALATPDIGNKAVGVLLRLSPNKSGEIYGMHLYNASVPKNTPTELAKKFSKSAWDFSDEQEIVRYSGPKARVTDIKKIFVKGKEKKNKDGDVVDREVAITYIIDLEEQGMEPKNVHEAYESMDDWEKKRKNPTFDKEMNTKFNQSGKSAADDAHEMGLISKGGAYWMDKDGNTVAKTVDDKLVKIASADITKTDYLKIKTGNQKGTNKGGFYTGNDKVERYVKFYPDESQAYCEKLTSSLYRALNIGAPKTAVFKSKGQTALASDMLDGFVNKNLGFDKKTANKILDGVAADILMANWDAVGLEDDNILISADGEVNRIDNGGSLLFRAQAGRKPQQLLDAIPEFNGFGDKAINPAYAKMMNKAGYKSVADMGERFVEQVRDLARLRHRVGGWEKFVDETAPEMNPKDKAQVIQMMNTRYKLLLQKAVEMGKQSTQTESSDPWGGESPFYPDEPGKQKENPAMKRFLRTKGAK